MLVWRSPVPKRHWGLGGTADRGVSRVSTWRSRSPRGSPGWLSTEAVSLLVITWLFSPMSKCQWQGLLCLSHPSGIIMILHQVAENFLCWAQKQSDLAQYFESARLQCCGHRHGCVGFLVVWSLGWLPLRLAHGLALGSCCVMWLTYAYCHWNNKQEQESGQTIVVFCPSTLTFRNDWGGSWSPSRWHFIA